MRQAAFDPVVVSKDFDKLCFFDAVALRQELTKHGMNCEGSTDSKLLQRLKTTFLNERGASKYKKRELALYDETMKTFLKGFHEFFVRKFGFQPTMESLQVSCRHVFAAFANESYLDSVMTLPKFKREIFLWGMFSEEFLHTRAGRRTYEESISKRDVTSTAEAFLQEHYISKGYKKPQEEASDVDVLKRLVNKLEHGNVVSKVDKVDICVGFVQQLKSSGVTSLEGLSTNELISLANSWLA